MPSSVGTEKEKIHERGHRKTPMETGSVTNTYLHATHMDIYSIYRLASS